MNASPHLRRDISLLCHVEEGTTITRMFTSPTHSPKGPLWITSPYPLGSILTLWQNPPHSIHRADLFFSFPWYFKARLLSEARTPSKDHRRGSLPLGPLAHVSAAGCVGEDDVLGFYTAFCVLSFPSARGAGGNTLMLGFQRFRIQWRGVQWDPTTIVS